MYQLLITLALCTTSLMCSDTIKRSPLGENWKIISRGSIGTGAVGFNITNPGNYMLSESVTPASGSATAIIQISTDDVVLDLAGHSLNGSTITTTGKGLLINGKKNITIKNGNLNSIPGINLHVVTGSSNVRLENITITNPGTANDIQLDSNSTKLSGITIIGGGTTGIALNIANGLNDITFDGIRISNIAGKAISIGNACYNVRIKNAEIDTCTGTSIGITVGTTCYDILMDGLRLSNITSDGITIGASCYGITMRNGFITNATGNGVNLSSDTHGIQLSNFTITGCTSGILSAGTNGGIIENCTVSRSIGASGYGCKLASSQNVLIQKSNFFESTSAGNPVSGIWLSSCTNVTCNNVQSGGHTGAQAFGFKLDTNCSGCSFDSCIARADFATSVTANQGAYGFYLSGAKGCNFTNCISTSNQGAVQGCGYYLTSCSSNTFVDCKALQNNVTTGSATALAAGFYSVGGASNRWQRCESNGQNAGNVASTAGYGAVGFYFSNEIQSSLYQCKALGNGSLSAHAATAAGFYFDATLNPACRCLEMRECAANSNCTSATTGTTAYGFWDTAVGTSNVFIDCYAASNSDSATPRIVTNYWANLPIGGTTAANFPRVEASIDGLLDIANKPLFYNVSITS